MRSNIPCVMSITRCWDEASQLSSAFLGRDSPGVDTAVGDTSTPSDPTSRRNTACLASRRSRSWSCITGRTRSEAVFQWSLDSGLRVITNFGLWKSSRGVISGTYSNRGEELSPRRWGKPTRLLGPNGVEPEAPELGRSQGLLTYLQHIPAGHVQQDRVLQGHQEHAAHL